jgi:glycosyltransferase involved in cell wall biosynthesis
MKKKVLVIAPLPPPITGNSLAVSVLLESLQDSFEFSTIDLSRPFNSGLWNRFKRIYKLLSTFRQVYYLKKNVDSIYFTVSESFMGNLKDICLFIICFDRLNDMIIHLHGGAGMRQILKANKYLSYINFIFLRRLKGIIVLGPSFIDLYSDRISLSKIHIVPNFSQETLFIQEKDLINKFQSISPLRVVYISNFNAGKGYFEIVKAYKQLCDELREKIKIDFAGDFESDKEKSSFLNSIKGYDNLLYLGKVYNEAKTNLFFSSHVFVLPTYYKYEGQPISILEAYSSGCVVVTTNHSGIIDIFKCGVNGFEVEKKSVNSLSDCFIRLISCNSSELQKMAFNNYSEACKFYKTIVYSNSLKNLI